MSADDALVAVLEADAGVTALVGTRIYANALPQNPVYPAIRYARISTDRANWRVLQRSVANKATRALVRYQIDIFALTKLEANDIAAAVRAALDGFAGTAASFKIDQTMIDSETDTFEADIGPGGAHIFGKRQDYLVSHAE